MAKTAPSADGVVASTDNQTGGIMGQRLRSFIERIERLQEEVATLRDDIKEVKAEAKGNGFDLKVITYLLKIRKADKDDLDEFEALVEIYKRALGMAAPDSAESTEL